MRGALDNPVWESLSAAHTALAQRAGRAARYPAEVSPFAAVEAQDREALGDLTRVVPEGGYVALFEQAEPFDDSRWETLQRFEAIQMVCDKPVARPDREPLPLAAVDASDALALAELTRPGPFSLRTLELGLYVGFRDGGRLVAMGGERLRPKGCAEVSGVCTAPEARGRGLAESVVRTLVAQIQARGELPFLHVQVGSPSQATAAALYERIGFREHRRARLAVLRRRPKESA